MSDDTSPNVVLTADTSQFERQMNSAATATNKVTSGVMALNGALNQLTQRGGRKLEIIGASTLAGLTAMTVSAGKLQAQMSQLQANAKMTGTAFSVSERSVAGLRREFGLASEQAVQLVTQLTKMGQSQGSIKDLSTTMVRLSAVTGESLSGLTDGLISLQRQMGVQGAGYTKVFASGLANVAASAGVSATNVLQFSNAIAPLGRVAGMSTKEILGVSTAFVKSGQDGYAAANAFNKMLTDITRSIQYGSPELKAYSNLIGVSVDQFKAMPRTQAITEIFDTISKQGPDAIKTLERFGLDGIRTYRALQAVASQGGIGQAINDTMAGMTPSGQDKFVAASKEALGGLNDEMGKVAANASMIGQAFGAGLLPAFTKATAAVNMFLGPLGQVLQLLGAIPGAGMAAGAGTTLMAGLLLRQFGKLTALGLGAAVVKGLPGKGFGAGRRSAQGMMGPNTEAEAAYMAGEGGMFQRGIYGAGRWAGEGYERLRSGMPGREPGEGMLSRANHLGGWGVGQLGQFARYGLEPLYNENMNNPFNRKPMFTSSSPGEFFRAQGQNIRTAAGNVRGLLSTDSDTRAATRAAMAMSNLGAETTRQRGLFSALGAETRNLMVALSKASLGATTGFGVGAGRIAGRGLAKVGGAAMDFLGGPIGVGLLGATAAYGMYRSEKNGWDDFRSDTSNNSAISKYSEALGVAGDATVQFAQVVKQAASDAASAAAPKTVSEGLGVTAADATMAGKSTTRYTDPRVSSMSNAQAVQFASAAVGSNSMTPDKATLLKLDLVKRFGATGAQSILDQAQAAQAKGIPDLYAGIDNQWKFAGMSNIWHTSGNTRNAAALAASNTQTLMASAPNLREQSRIALVSANSAALAAGKNSANPLAIRAQAEALAKGLNITDPKGISSIEHSLIRYHNGGSSLEQFQREIASSGTEAGQVLDFARRNAGAGYDYSTTTYVPPAAKPGQRVSNLDPGAITSLQSQGGLARYITGDNRLGNQVNAAVGHPADTNLQYSTAINLAETFSKVTGSASSAIEALSGMQRAASGTQDPLYQLAATAMQVVRQRQGEAMGYMTDYQRGSQLNANLAASTAAANAPGAGPEARQTQEADRAAREAGRLAAFQKFTQIALQARELNISLQRGEEDMAQTRAWAYADFDKMRGRAELAYNKSRTRAEADFNRSRRRQTEDFNHQLVLMTRQAAKEVYSIYDRITVQQTWSAANLMQNIGDQQQALDEQVANLSKIRKMGVSSDVIKMLGLNQTENAQQLARFTADLMEDPAMVASFNRAAKARLKTAKKLVTDEDNEQWTEMRRSFKLNIKRAQEDFNIGMAHQREDFRLQLSQSRTDFDTSMSRQQVMYQKQINRAHEDMNRMYTQLTGDFNQIAKLAIGSLSGTAKTQAQTLYDAFADIKKKLPKIVADLITAVGTAATGSANAVEHALGSALGSVAAGATSSGSGTGSANAAENSATNKSNQRTVQQIASKYGWDKGAEWKALYQLIMHESGFNNTAQNPSSTAYGMFQFLKDTWKPYGAKTSDPAIQSIYGLKYIKDRYGDPVNAWAKWQSRSPHWYGDGAIFNSGAQTIGVGERGPEAVLPLNKRGADFIMEMVKHYNGNEMRQSAVRQNSVPMQAMNSIHYTTVDSSTNYNIDHLSVAASDPNEMARKMEAKKRLQALAGRK